MAKKQTVLAGKRKLELSNLDKILYPGDGIVKAEVLQYYVTIAPYMLRYVRGRPLSLVRFPDGIEGEQFFQKNRPDWVPEWLHSVKLGDIDYMLAEEDAAVVFLANLAALEFHQMQMRPSVSQDADYMVFDLDPPENSNFEIVRDLALNLRPYLESLGYHVFVKTTGGKGLHLIMPLLPHSYDIVFEAAKAAAVDFASRNKGVTLEIKKERRAQNILLDVYRNRSGQTIVSPFSLRGKPGAPVSMPLSWEDLERARSPLDYNLRNAYDLIRQGDPWEGMYAHTAVPHNARAKLAPVTAELETYKKKRSFDKTPEPAPAPSAATGQSFVLHRHHASHLHYDLRLEQDGALTSWAVPRGLPPRPGIKRLAVHTENHPIEYLTFEGKIPKGQYGAGEMWIFARGQYEITKQKKDGFYFRTHAEGLHGEYRMIHTRDKEWLMERLDEEPRLDFEPMLATQTETVPSGDMIFEVKWDGIRALVFIEDGQITIRSRNGRDITAAFPEVAVPDSYHASSAVLDGEIVCLDENGRPVFQNVIRRLQNGANRKLEQKFPAFIYLFDVLSLDGKRTLKDPLHLRRAWVQDLIRTGGAVRFSQSYPDGQALFDAAKEHGLEGIMAKSPDSPYVLGRRSTSWVKIKVRSTMDCVIIGYTEGEGGREKLGSVHVAEKTESGLHYVGKVGSGFSDEDINDLSARLATMEIERPTVKVPKVEKGTWVEASLVCEVEYASKTRDGMLREPVFIRLRPDL